MAQSYNLETSLVTSLILKEVARKFASHLSIVPNTNIKKLNKYLEDQNLIEKLYLCNYRAFYDGLSALILLFSEGELHIVPAQQVLEIRTLFNSKVIKAKIAISKQQGKYNNVWEQDIVEYEVKGNKTRVKRYIEDNKGKVRQYTKNVDKIYDVNFCPIMLLKGTLSEENLLEQLKILFSGAEKIYTNLYEEFMIAGNKIVIKGQTVNNVSGGTTAAQKLAESILQGDKVIVQNASFDKDISQVEVNSMNNHIKDLTTGFDWILNKIIQLSGAPDLNGADKGTANLQTTEVLTNMLTKLAYLDIWNKSRERQWKIFFKAYSRLNGSKMPTFTLTDELNKDSIKELTQNEELNPTSNVNARSKNEGGVTNELQNNNN